MHTQHTVEHTQPCTTQICTSLPSHTPSPPHPPPLPLGRKHSSSTPIQDIPSPTAHPAHTNFTTHTPHSTTHGNSHYTHTQHTPSFTAVHTQTQPPCTHTHTACTRLIHGRDPGAKTHDSHGHHTPTAHHLRHTQHRQTHTKTQPFLFSL